MKIINQQQQTKCNAKTVPIQLHLFQNKLWQIISMLRHFFYISHFIAENGQ